MAFLIFFAGCWYNPHGLPLVDEVPIVASDRCDESREVFVSSVRDGDTFEVNHISEEPEVFRMLGIDAPETEKFDAPAECWADPATVELSRRILQRNVLVTFDRTCQGVFGRTLAYVWELDDDDAEIPISVNQRLVEEGHVRVFAEEFGAIIYQREYEISQDEADNRGLGLWGACTE